MKTILTDNNASFSSKYNYNTFLIIITKEIIKNITIQRSKTKQLHLRNRRCNLA